MAFLQMSSGNQPKLHKTREITVAVIMVAVLLLIALTLASNFFKFHPTSTPVPYPIVGGTITINSSSYKGYHFTVYPDVASQNVEGTFAVSNSSDGSGIKVYIMNDANFANWKNGTAFSTYYDSGEATSGNISVLPPAGTYYLVFDNTFSTTAKNIDAEIFNVVVPVD